MSFKVVGPKPGIIQTLVDSSALQEKAENSADYTSHHNETPHLEKIIENNKSSNLASAENKTVSKENVSVDINIGQGGEVVNASDNTQQTEKLATEVPTVEPKINVTKEKDETPEDIPSFSEWTQKQLEEAEKKKEEANSSVQNQHTNGKANAGNRKRWKNYASTDCGAKIIAANPEANSAGSVLSASRDEYKLNACVNRIWFIVELCEAIQAVKIELANFELFSSSPKEFSISVSDRFPTREWSSVGQFVAKDERDIQSFDLHPHLFGKFIKFEMHSHYGSEHYCPISLFRVFGTSEFEVLETENEGHANAVDDDDDDNESIIMDTSNPPTNLFSTATDAVISIVKKAAEVLGNKGNGSSSDKNVTVAKYSPLISTCTTPSHIVVCNNCSDLLFGNVFELLSCNSQSLVRLVSQPKVKHVLYHTDICSSFGLEICNKPSCKVQNLFKSYITSIFPPKIVAAMCNIVAINECKVVRNISTNATTTVITPQANDSKVTNTKFVQLPFTEEIVIGTSDTVVKIDTSVIQEKASTETQYSSQINPTRTLTSEVESFPIDATVNVDSSSNEQEMQTTESSQAPVQNDTVVIPPNDSLKHQMEHIEVSSEVVQDIETSTESSEHLEDHLDSLVSDEESSNVASSTLSPPVLPHGQKESVFLRLSNRIKALERNMSLSSQYLEELSRRYKKQVEEMQRLLDKTINTLNEENKKKEERTQHLEDQIVMLRESIDLLIEDKKAWMNTTYWLFLSGVVIVGFLLFCRRNQEFNQPVGDARSTNNQVWRRMSVDAITNKTPVKKRRPSEEALLHYGAYTDLVVDELDGGLKLKGRKRKKRSLQRSNSITTLDEEVPDKAVEDANGCKFIPISNSTQIWRRQDSAPPSITMDWSDNSIKNNKIEELPFVLDESEHTSLEQLTYIKEPPKIDTFDHVKTNGNIQSATFITTAADCRAKRSLQNPSIVKLYDGHKKSASFDENLRLNSSPDERLTDSSSVSNNVDELKIIELPKKEKKNALKRLFKSLTFK
ncbi:SUN domain-containing ossification factor-like [Photinus pyralis]|uniref:SUN domain-containing ossification factor-like n=1 Tax=Photinus pyralis TaxID=7054 RepID=UPI0012674FDF|nr:SUN domain-containing ossification factor-like [Photinus pyralis]